jgi:hypothetical protein
LDQLADALRSGNAVTDLGDQLLLRVEMIPDPQLQRPDLVQQQQLSRNVVPQIPDQLLGRDPLLLLHMRAFVLVPGPRAGQRQALVAAVTQQWALTGQPRH